MNLTRFTQFERIAAGAAAILLLFFVLFSGLAHAIPAFPGAEGGGAISLGGRNASTGKVIQVTSLNDPGAGTLRACVEASGPRTCVFTVGGTINLLSELTIRNPFITIAGQTAPGGGILLSGKNMGQSMIKILAPNTIIRYIRVRKGWHPTCADPAAGECGTNVLIGGGASSPIIVDHVSASWNQDEGLASDGKTVNGITFSYNISAPELKDHSTSAFINSDAPAQAVNIDFHHNLFMNGSHRVPLVKAGTGRHVNNLYYNHSRYYTQIGGGGSVDFIGNLYKRGPQAPSLAAHEIQAYFNSSGAPNFGLPGAPSIYLLGNIGWNQTNAAGDQFVMAARIATENAGEDGTPIPTGWRRGTPLANTTHPITLDPVANIEATILPIVGASRRLDCTGKWVANRDGVDTRLISQYTNNTGISARPQKEDGVGGYPAIAGGTPCADTDKDGMPDAFEVIQVGNPTSFAPNADADADGFLNLEEYLDGEAGATPPPVGDKFQVNDRVFVNADTANVRNPPANGSAGSILGTQSRNAQGTVTGGPSITNNNVAFYNINFDTGTDGWVGDGVLEKVVNEDSPPSVSISAPVAGTTVSGATVTVSATASDNVGVVGVQFKLDGANLGAEDTASPYSITWDSTASAKGTHILSAVARDAAGNTTNSTSVSVTVSNVAADQGFTVGEVAILGTDDTHSGNVIEARAFTVPQRGTIQSMTMHGNSTAGSVRMGIYDDDGAGGDPGTLLGETAAVSPSASFFTANIVTPVTIDPGTYYLAFVTNGLAVLKGTSTGATRKKDTNTFGPLTNPFVVSSTSTNSWRWTLFATFTPAADTTAPTVTMTAPAAGNVSGSAVTVSATASDDVAVSGVQFKLDGTVDIGAEDTTSPYSVTWDTTPVANGAHTLTGVGRDAAGNKATSAGVAVTVANTLVAPSGLVIVREAP